MATCSTNSVWIFVIVLFCYLHFVEVVVGSSQPIRSLKSLLSVPFGVEGIDDDQKSPTWGFSVQYNSTSSNQKTVGQERPGQDDATNEIDSSKSKSPPKKRKKRGAMIRAFLYEHNKIRQELNEPALAWDKKLAKYAERFANGRKKDCDLVHSNGEYGESIYWGMHYDRHSAAEAVRAWASEGKYYDLNTHSCTGDQECGHYTQMIWKSSKRIGCARVKCDDGGVFIICVYDPPGNYRNEDPLSNIV